RPIPLIYGNSNYSYYFVAEDDYGVVGTPTATFTGPVVTGGINFRPELFWLGTESYISDGIAPEIGTPGTVFTFKVRYRDLNDNPPKPGYPKLHVGNNGNWRELQMTWVDDGIGGTRSCGIYMATTTLQIGGYKYWIEAYEDHTDNNSVKLPIRGEMSGPVVTYAPILTWTNESGFESDGVSPDYGTVSTTPFTYKVRYYDADGDAPQYVQVWIYKDGVRIHGSPFSMSLEPGSGHKADGYYKVRFDCFTEPGTYSYVFKAIGRDGVMAIGTATVGTMTGPIVRSEFVSAPSIKPPVVAEELKLIDAYNCPNPTYTGETNIVGVLDTTVKVTGLKVIVNIYDIAGDLVWSYESTMETDTRKRFGQPDKQAVVVPWNCRNDVGEEVANGVYIFRIIVSRDGKTMSKIGKIAVIR
ncbi:MAG: hypothetical protein AB1567_03780, partial [bacterium]